MNTSSKHIIIVAGEASGDTHAAHLVNEIKSLDPNIIFSGLGGTQMRQSGVELYTDLTKLAVVGFIEVFKNYSEFKKIFYDLLAKIKEVRPAAVILVDYPGFNLRLAKKIKKLGIKVIYYISPQVWAWKKNRVRLIDQFTDKMLVLFPFEKEFYAKHGIDVEFVGHPLLDSLQASQSREEFLLSLGISKNRLTIGILPGSREKEIERMLPSMLKAAQILNNQRADVQFIVPISPNLKRPMVEDIISSAGSLPLSIVDGQSHDVINASDLCMVTSGTATLETAILQKPMVVVYKTSFISWLLAKMFIKIPHIGLVNIVAGKKVVPECIQFDATPEKIAEESKRILSNEACMNRIKEELLKVKNSLGEPGASRRAAQKILEMI